MQRLHGGTKQREQPPQRNIVSANSEEIRTDGFRLLEESTVWKVACRPWTFAFATIGGVFIV